MTNRIFTAAILALLCAGQNRGAVSAEIRLERDSGKAQRATAVLSILTQIHRVASNVPVDAGDIGSARRREIDQIVAKAPQSLNCKTTLAHAIMAFLGSRDSEDKEYDAVFLWAYWRILGRIAEDHTGRASEALQAFRVGTDGEDRHSIDLLIRKQKSLMAQYKR